jgi:hypothetical protein
VAGVWHAVRAERVRAGFRHQPRRLPHRGVDGGGGPRAEGDPAAPDRDRLQEGRWVAANKALGITLATEVEIHADDAHINAISRAEVALLRDLESKPLACRAYLLAGGMADELMQAQPNDKLVWLAQRAALKNGFERRMRGLVWTRPDDRETWTVMRRLGRGPVTALTPAEETARAKYLDGAPELICSGAIKESINLMAMSEVEAARARRIAMANTARIDPAQVMARVCGDLNQGWSCP